MKAAAIVLIILVIIITLIFIFSEEIEQFIFSMSAGKYDIKYRVTDESAKR